jgi:hypothetical protein
MTILIVRRATPGSDPEHGEPALWNVPAGSDLEAYIAAQFASPPAIGSGTPAAGTFTALQALTLLLSTAVPASPVASTIYKDAGKWVEIGRQTASSSAAVTFTGLDGRYKAIRFRGVDVVPETDDDELRVRVTVATAVQSGGSDYSWASNFSDSGAGNAGFGDGADDAIDAGGTGAGDGWGNAATEVGSFWGWLTGHASTAKHKIIYLIAAYLNGGGLSTVVHVSGAYRGTSAVDGISFSFVGGDIGAGTFILEGLVNA